MRVFNKEKTKELEDFDLTKGRLEEDVLITYYNEVEPVEEKGHYEIVNVYDNGGKDVEWVVDQEAVEGKKAYQETEHIYIYIPFNEEELKEIEKNNKLNELYIKLSEPDYEAIKYAEGCYTEEEYQPIREYRESLREEIRKLID